MRHNPFIDIISGYEDSDLRQGLPPGCDRGPAPLVSVWVSTYNQEKYIRQCLDGILMQKVNFPYEVIVADDCSTDNNQNIILEYAEKYPDIIRPILGKQNIYSKKRSRVLEQFIPLARGKYMTMCEGDDYWTYPGRMQALADFLDTHPKHSMVFHAFKGLSEVEGLEANFPKLPRARTVGVFEVLIEPHVQFATCMGRLDVLRNDTELQNQYQRNQHVFFDMRLYISWFNAGKVYCIPEYWSVYRVQPMGVYTQLRTTNENKRNDIKTLQTLETYYGGKYPNLVKQRLKFLNISNNLNKWTYSRREGKYLKALYQLIIAFLKQPILFSKIYFDRYLL